MPVQYQDLTVNPRYQGAIRRRMADYGGAVTRLPQYADIDRQFAGAEAQKQMRAEDIGARENLARRQFGTATEYAKQQQKYLDIDRDRAYQQQRDFLDTSRRQNRLANIINLGGVGVSAYGGYKQGQYDKEQQQLMRQMTDAYLEGYVKHLVSGYTAPSYSGAQTGYNDYGQAPF